MNSLSVISPYASRIHYEFYISCSNLLWIYSLFRGLPQIHYFFLNKLWIHYQIREFTINSLSSSLIYYEFILSHANLLWVHYQLRKCIINQLCSARIHSELTFFPRIYYEFTIFIANSLWIHHLCRVFFICYVNLLWIFYFICELALNTLYFSQIYYVILLYFANLLCIYYFFRGIPLNSLVFRKFVMNPLSFRNLCVLTFLTSN